MELVNIGRKGYKDFLLFGNRGLSEMPFIRRDSQGRVTSVHLPATLRAAAPAQLARHRRARTVHLARKRLRRQRLQAFQPKEL